MHDSVGTGHYLNNGAKFESLVENVEYVDFIGHMTEIL